MEFGQKEYKKLVHVISSALEKALVQMNPLTSIIKSIIHDSGPMTFAKFMELALYHPEYGYYSSGKARIGKKGDYYTSPCVHPAFGEILGRFISRAYEAINAPDLKVIEMGAGKGYLAL